LGNYTEILNTNTEGIVLDTIKNKMYINGRKLKYVDLVSQTTTIHVLDKLLANIGKDIGNKELEPSSYSKNKNEMLGKIILPLMTLIEKETGEKFPLICR
jgi:hypothetical protein